MKKTKAVFGLLAISSALVAQVQAQSFLTDGLVAYYPLKGNANDESGNGNNGVAYETLSTTNRFGMPNSALLFNGTNAYVWIGTNVRPPVISVSAWFLTSARTNPVGDAQDMLLRDRFQGWHFQIDMPTGAVDVEARPTASYYTKTTTGYNDGAWPHLPMTVLQLPSMLMALWKRKIWHPLMRAFCMSPAALR